MEKKCELLAPAGGMRQFYAAVENGADAVYIRKMSEGVYKIGDIKGCEEYF